MTEPKSRFGYFGLTLILALMFLVPMNVCAQENMTSAKTTPVTAISLDAKILNQVTDGGNDRELPNSSYQSRNDTGKSLVNDNKRDFITDSRTGQKYVKDRIIIRFKSQNNALSSISQEKIHNAHTKVGARVEEDFGNSGIDGLQVVKLPAGTDVQSAIKAYESNPDVMYAEPDYLLSITPDQFGPMTNNADTANILSIPNDELFSNQWSFHNIGQSGGTPGADIDASGAWNISTGSSSVIVAVIDTGVLYNHTDLSSNIWNNTGEIPGNGVDDDSNGYIDDIRGWNFIANTSDPIDDHGHGTHVSGTIGAVGNNTFGVAGVNWQVRIMPLKTFDTAGSGDTTTAIKAIGYANANGATVISNSWGGPEYSQALNDIINASPAVIVCAAGNTATNNDNSPVYPASYNGSNTISVTATDQNDALAWFSNIGPNSVDLAAPGTNILSTYKDGNYSSMSGTSMATPHVSGVAALLKAKNLSLTSGQIKKIVLSTVDPKPSLSGIVASGGRLNAYKAVLATDPPVADFIGAPMMGTAPLTVAFSDNSTNTPTTWNWTFGDGSTVNATVRSPFHTYLKGGNFTVSLNVTNVVGFNSTTKAGYINLTNRTTKIGVFRNGGWYLDYDGNGIWDSGIDNSSAFGAPGWTSVVGDWNGDGKTKIGVYKDGAWYLDYDGTGIWDAGKDNTSMFGAPGWTSVVGDWNGDGKTKVGVYKDGGWYLDYDGNGIWDAGKDNTSMFGAPGWTSVVGDWNGNGKTKVGVYKDGAWYLDYDGTGIWDAGKDNTSMFGAPGWTSVVGDWNGDGKTKVGVYKDGAWYLDYDGTGIWDTGKDREYSFGASGWTSVVGDWNGDGKTKVGVYKDGAWYLDYDGNGIWDTGKDREYSFGSPGWTSVVGKWS
jgi:thermitase